MTNSNPSQNPANQELALQHLLFVAGAAIAIRVLWVLLVPVIPESDSVAYLTFAKNLLTFGTYGWDANTPTAFWPPGTALLYALAFLTLGENLISVVALNIATATGVILVSAKIAHRFFGRDVALACAWILALWPTLILYSTVLAGELMFLFFSLVALDFWTSRNSRKIFLSAAGAGIALGIAALIRPQALLLPLIFLFAAVAASKISLLSIQRNFLYFVTAVLTMAVVIAPWTIRNYKVFGEPVLISTNGGVTLWMGNAAGTDSQYLDVPAIYDSLPENERARVLGAEAKRIIAEDPGAFMQRAIKKFFLLYANESVGVIWNEKGITQSFGESWVNPMKYATRAGWAVIVLLATIGFFAGIRRIGWRPILFSPFLLMILYFTITHMVVKAQDRYHLAFATQIAVFSAIGLAFLKSWLRPEVDQGIPQELPSQ
jgi:4-amino-4-deoxy-L-arabinose transferase-like glycosyltransferase